MSRGDGGRGGVTCCGRHTLGGPRSTGREGGADGDGHGAGRGAGWSGEGWGPLTLAVVLVAGQAVNLRRVVRSAHVAYPLLRALGRTAGDRVQVEAVVLWLVAMVVLTEAESSHLGHLVDDVAVRARLEVRRRCKHRVELAHEALPPTHHLCQPRRVVRHAPRALPHAALDVCAAPRELAVRPPGAVGLPTAREA